MLLTGGVALCGIVRFISLICCYQRRRRQRQKEDLENMLTTKPTAESDDNDGNKNPVVESSRTMSPGISIIIIVELLVMMHQLFIHIKNHRM